MKVFEFEKCLMERLEESFNVLSWETHGIPASGVQSQWSFYIELQIEPTGWQTLWKIPRVICEQLNIKYPTVVYGIVEQVLFKELKAMLLVTAVQDDDIHLPEQQEVNLIDLFPTQQQENTELNIEKTANCIDGLRFFYNNLWMPWDNDNDDDFDWAEKHLETRIRFYYDLKKSDMKRSLADYIKTLLVEAKYIQERREYLSLSLSDDDDDEYDEEIGKDFKEKQKVSDLMHLHLRLTKIKSKIEMLENPKMRKVFEDIKYNNIDNSANTQTEKNTVYIVTKPLNLDDQLTYLARAKLFVKPEKLVQICSSLQNAFDICNAMDEIILFPGKHSVTFMEYLNDNGSICGLNSVNNDSNATTIMSASDECILLVINGDFTFKNLKIDCQNVRTGILIRNGGNVCLENCQIVGNSKSSTNQGIFVTGRSTLMLKNCYIENFATGITINTDSHLTFIKSTINSCQIGIEFKDQVNVNFDELYIKNSKNTGIYIETAYLQNNIEKKIVNNIIEMQKILTLAQPWNGECFFQNNTKGNIQIVNINADELFDVCSVEHIDLISSPPKSASANLSTMVLVAEGDLSDSVYTDSVVIVDDSMCE